MKVFKQLAGTLLLNKHTKQKFQSLPSHFSGMQFRKCNNQSWIWQLQKFQIKVISLFDLLLVESRKKVLKVNVHSQKTTKKATDVYLFPQPVGEGPTFELTFLLQHKSEER